MQVKNTASVSEVLALLSLSSEGIFDLSYCQINIITVPHIVQGKHDLQPQKINNPMGVCMYLYLFTSTAWKFICTVCSTVLMFKISSKYLDVVLSASITSACSSSERDIIKSLSQQKRNKSATRGAQLEPKGTPTTCLYSLVPN